MMLMMVSKFFCCCLYFELLPTGSNMKFISAGSLIWRRPSRQEKWDLLCNGFLGNVWATVNFVESPFFPCGWRIGRTYISLQFFGCAIKYHFIWNIILSLRQYFEYRKKKLLRFHFIPSELNSDPSVKESSLISTFVGAEIRKTIFKKNEESGNALWNAYAWNRTFFLPPLWNKRKWRSPRERERKENAGHDNAHVQQHTHTHVLSKHYVVLHEHVICTYMRRRQKKLAVESKQKDPIIIYINIPRHRPPHHITY